MKKTKNEIGYLRVIFCVSVILFAGFVALNFKNAFAQENVSCGDASLVQDIGGGQKRVILSNLGPAQTFFCQSGNQACETLGETWDCKKIEFRCNLNGNWSLSSAGCSTTNFSSVCQYSAVCGLPELRGLVIYIKEYGTNENLQGVSVRIEDSQGQPIETQTTGQDGKTQAVTLPVGETYKLEITKPGYNSRTIFLVIPSGNGTYTRGPIALSSSTPTLRSTVVQVIGLQDIEVIEGAEVRIERDEVHVVTKITGEDGKTDPVPLQVGKSHSFKITKPGFEEFIVTTIVPPGNDVFTQNALLTPTEDFAGTQLRGVAIEVKIAGSNTALADVTVRIERDGQHVVTKITRNDGKTDAVPLRVGQRHRIRTTKIGYNPSIILLTIPSGSGTFIYNAEIVASDNPLQDILVRLDGILTDLQSVQQKALEQSSYYESINNQGKKDKFMHVATLSLAAKEIANEIIAKIEENINDFDVIKQELKNDFTNLRGHMRIIENLIAE